MSHTAPPFKIPQSVLVVIYTPEQQVLLIERADEQGAGTGFWQSVTGSLDAVDEPWKLAAQREVWEETGIDCSLPGCTLTDWYVEKPQFGISSRRNSKNALSGMDNRGL